MVITSKTMAAPPLQISLLPAQRAKRARSNKRKAFVVVGSALVAAGLLATKVL